MSWKEERDLRVAIVEIHRRLYELGFSVANDGNTSARLDGGRILITPAGLNKAKLEPNQMAMIDMDGTPISGNYPPSSEINVHTMVYKARPDVQAIIHAHPPFCIACSLAGVSLEQYALPEVVIALGKIPTAPYATAGTKEAGKTVAEYMKKHDAVIMARHGSVTVGKSLDDALQKLERIEHSAKIMSIANALGKVPVLPRDEVSRLLQIGVSMGMQKEVPDEEEIKPMIAEATKNIEDEDQQRLIELITEEVKAALANRS